MGLLKHELFGNSEGQGMERGRVSFLNRVL